MVPRFKFTLVKIRNSLINFYIFILNFSLRLKLFTYFFFKLFYYFLHFFIYFIYFLNHKVKNYFKNFLSFIKNKFLSSYLFGTNYKKLYFFNFLVVCFFFYFFNNFYFFIIESLFFSGCLNFCKLIFNFSYEPFIGLFSEFWSSPIFFLSNSETFFSSIFLLLYKNFFNYSETLFFFFDYSFFYNLLFYNFYYTAPVYESGFFFLFFLSLAQFLRELFSAEAPFFELTQNVEFEWFFYQYYHKIFFQKLFINYTKDIEVQSSSLLVKNYSDIALDYSYYSRMLSKDVVLNSIQHFFDIQSLLIFDFSFYNYHDKCFIFDFGLYSCTTHNDFNIFFISLSFCFFFFFIFWGLHFLVFFFSFVLRNYKKFYARCSIIFAGDLLSNLTYLGGLSWFISENSFFLNKFYYQLIKINHIHLSKLVPKFPLKFFSFLFYTFFLRFFIRFCCKLSFIFSIFNKGFFQLFLFKYFALFYLYYLHYILSSLIVFFFNWFIYLFVSFLKLKKLLITLFYQHYFTFNKYLLLFFLFIRYLVSALIKSFVFPFNLGQIYRFYVKFLQQSYFLLIVVIQGPFLTNTNFFFNTQYFFTKNLSFFYSRFWQLRSTIFFFFDLLDKSSVKNFKSFFLLQSLVPFKKPFFLIFSFINKIKLVSFFFFGYFSLLFSSLFFLNSPLLQTKLKDSIWVSCSSSSAIDNHLFHYVFSSIYYNEAFFNSPRISCYTYAEGSNPNPINALAPTFSEIFGFYYHAFGGLLQTSFGPIAQIFDFTLTNIFYGNISSIYFGFSRPIFLNLNDYLPLWVFSESFFNLLRLAVDPRYFYAQSTYSSSSGLESGPTFTELFKNYSSSLFQKNSFFHTLYDFFDNYFWVSLRLKGILPVETYNNLSPWVLSEDTLLHLEYSKLSKNDIPPYVSYLPQRFLDNFLTTRNESLLYQPLSLSRNNYLTKVEGVFAFDYDKIVPNLFHYQRMPTSFAHRHSYLNPTNHETLNLLYKFRNNLNKISNHGLFEKDFLIMKLKTKKHFVEHVLNFVNNFIYIKPLKNFEPQFSARFFFYNPKRYFSYNLNMLQEQFYYKPDFFKNPNFFMHSQFFGKDLEHLFLYYPTLFTVPHSFFFPTTVYNTSIAVPPSHANDPLYYMEAHDESFYNIYETGTLDDFLQPGRVFFNPDVTAYSGVNGNPAYNELTGMHKAGILYENTLNQNLTPAKNTSFATSIPFGNVRSTEIFTQGGFDNRNSTFFLNFYQGTFLSDFSKFSQDIPFLIPKSITLETEASKYNHPDVINDSLIFSTRFTSPNSSYLAFEDNADYSEDYLLLGNFYNYWKESFFDLFIWDIYHFLYDLNIVPLFFLGFVQVILFIFFSFFFFLFLRKISYIFLFPKYFLMTPFFFFEIYAEFNKNSNGISRLIFNQILNLIKQDSLFRFYFKKKTFFSILVGILPEFLDRFSNYSIKHVANQLSTSSVNAEMIKAQIFLLKELAGKSQHDVMFTHYYIQLLKNFFQYNMFFTMDKSFVKKFFFFNTFYSKQSEFNRLFKNEINYGFTDNSLKKFFLKKEWADLLMQYIPQFDYTYFNFFYDFVDTEISFGKPETALFFNQLSTLSTTPFKSSLKINIPIQLYSFFNRKFIWNYFTWTSLGEETIIEDEFIEDYFETYDEDLRASDLIDIQYLNLAEISPVTYLKVPVTILPYTYSAFDFTVEDSNQISELFYEDIFMDHDSDESDSPDFLPGFSDIFLDFSEEQDLPQITNDMFIFDLELSKPYLLQSYLKSQFQFFGDILPSFWSEHALDFYYAYSTFFTAEPFRDNTFFETNDYVKIDDFGENPLYNAYGEFALPYSLEDSVEDFDLLRDFSANTANSMLDQDSVEYLPDLSFFRGYDKKSLTLAHRLSFFDDFGDDSVTLTQLNLKKLKKNLKKNKKFRQQSLIMFFIPFFKYFFWPFLERGLTSFDFNKNYELVSINDFSPKFWLKIFTKFNQKQLLKGKKPLTQDLFFNYYFYLQLSEFLEFDHSILKTKFDMVLLKELSLVRADVFQQAKSIPNGITALNLTNSETTWLVSQLNLKLLNTRANKDLTGNSDFFNYFRPSFFSNISHNLLFNHSDTIQKTASFNNSFYPDIFETQGSYLFENIDSFSHLYLAFTESSFALFTEYNKFFFLSSSVQEQSLQKFSEFDLYQKIKFQSFFGFNIFEDPNENRKFIQKRFSFILNDLNQLTYTSSVLNNFPFFLKKLETPLMPFFLFFNSVLINNWEFYRTRFSQKVPSTFNFYQFYCKTSFSKLLTSFVVGAKQTAWHHPLFEESLKNVSTFQEDITDYYSKLLLQSISNPNLNFEFAPNESIQFCEADFILEEQNQLLLANLEKDPMAFTIFAQLGLLDMSSNGHQEMSSAAHLYSEDSYNSQGVKESSALLHKEDGSFIKELGSISKQKDFSQLNLPLNLLNEKIKLLKYSVSSYSNFIKINQEVSFIFKKNDSSSFVNKRKFYFFDHLNILTSPFYFTQKKVNNQKDYFFKEFLVQEHYLFNYTTQLNEFENLNFSQGLLDITAPDYSGAIRSATLETNIHLFQNVNSLKAETFNASFLQSYGFFRQLSPSIFVEESSFEQLAHPAQIREFKFFDSIFFLLFKSFNLLYYYISLLMFSDSIFRLPTQFKESFNTHYYNSNFKPFFFLNFKELIILKPLRKVLGGVFFFKFVMDISAGSSVNFFRYFLTQPQLTEGKKLWAYTPLNYKKFFRYFFIDTLFCLKSIDTLRFIDPLKIRFYSFKKNDFMYYTKLFFKKTTSEFFINTYKTHGDLFLIFEKLTFLQKFYLFCKVIHYKILVRKTIYMKLFKNTTFSYPIFSLYLFGFYYLPTYFQAFHYDFYTEPTINITRPVKSFTISPLLHIILSGKNSFFENIGLSNLNYLMPILSEKVVTWQLTYYGEIYERFSFRYNVVLHLFDQLLIIKYFRFGFAKIVDDFNSILHLNIAKAFFNLFFTSEEMVYFTIPTWQKLYSFNSAPSLNKMWYYVHQSFFIFRKEPSMFNLSNWSKWNVTFEYMQKKLQYRSRIYNSDNLPKVLFNVYAYISGFLTREDEYSHVDFTALMRDRLGLIEKTPYSVGTYAFFKEKEQVTFLDFDQGPFWDLDRLLQTYYLTMFTLGDIFQKERPLGTEEDVFTKYALPKNRFIGYFYTAFQKKAQRSLSYSLSTADLVHPQHRKDLNERTWYVRLSWYERSKHTFLRYSVQKHISRGFLLTDWKVRWLQKIVVYGLHNFNHFEQRRLLKASFIQRQYYLSFFCRNK